MLLNRPLADLGDLGVVDLDFVRGESDTRRRCDHRHDNQSSTEDLLVHGEQGGMRSGFVSFARGGPKSVRRARHFGMEGGRWVWQFHTVQEIRRPGLESSRELASREANMAK